MSRYFHNIGIALSICGCAILGGQAYQTISAMNYERQQENKTNIVWLIDGLFRDDQHCHKSWLNWKRRKC